MVKIRHTYYENVEVADVKYERNGNEVRAYTETDFGETELATWKTDRRGFRLSSHILPYDRNMNAGDIVWAVRVLDGLLRFAGDGGIIEDQEVEQRINKLENRLDEHESD